MGCDRLRITESQDDNANKHGNMALRHGGAHTEDKIQKTKDKLRQKMGTCRSIQRTTTEKSHKHANIEEKDAEEAE